jgi:4-hydroxybenzoate polyprenyltransferase
MVRWGNQAIILFCLYSFHRLLLRFQEPTGEFPQMDLSKVACLGLSLVFLTSAGYLINAIRDEDTDRLNHPGRRWIPRHFSAKQVLSWYYLALFAGLIPAFWLAATLGLLIWLPLYPLTAYGLHRYSSVWKGRGIGGNLLVAGLSAAVPLLLLIPEGRFLQDLPVAQRGTLLSLFAGFSLFAFLLSLFREMIKDMEDLAGDRLTGWHTLAVIKGEETARRYAFLTGGSGVCALIAALLLPVPYGSLMMGLPILVLGLLWLLYRLYTARVSQDYHRISQGAKVLLAGGLFLIWLAP